MLSLRTGDAGNGYKNRGPRHRRDPSHSLDGNHHRYGANLNCHRGKHLHIAWDYALNRLSNLKLECDRSRSPYALWTLLFFVLHCRLVAIHVLTWKAARTSLKPL